MESNVATLLDLAKHNRGRIVVLTGAGISAESGIPTFRGPEGFWTVGSEVYQSQDMATMAMFSRHPERVWAWYLFRRTICLDAEPNDAHHALVELERAYGDRFVLITQNVDGLHLRAGSSPGRTYHIHGNLDLARCRRECGTPFFPMPSELYPWPKDRGLDEDTAAMLRCPSCEAWLRPHVLWFDECYDERNFRFESSRQAALEADLMVVCGTAGATNLPMMVGKLALDGGAAIIDVNVENNPFAELARESRLGHAITGAAAKVIPQLVDMLLK